MHHHDHAHAHGAPDTQSRAFAIGFGLNGAFVLVEIVFGLRARSLALLADAGHNLGDVLGLAMAWGALALSRRPPTARHTYGLRRASILAALVNAILLLVAVGGIAWEAIHRLANPPAVATGEVMVVAAVGVLLNGVSALLFLAGRHADLNVRSAFAHLASDAAISAGVLLAGWTMSRTGWAWLDPAVSLAVGAAIVWGTWSLLRESLGLAMDAVPRGVDLAAVAAYLRTLPGVTAVHDLHIWGMSTTESALTVHLVNPDAAVDDAWMVRTCRELHARFGIEHTTIQLEKSDAPCRQAPEHVV